MLMLKSDKPIPHGYMPVQDPNTRMRKIIEENGGTIEKELRFRDVQTFANQQLQDDKYQSAIQQLIRKHNLACEELTENQLAVVIRQALASGDIIKQVRVTDSAQNILYIPYAEADRLLGRVRYLEELLKQNGIEEP